MYVIFYAVFCSLFYLWFTPTLLGEVKIKIILTHKRPYSPLHINNKTSLFFVPSTLLFPVLQKALPIRHIQIC
jgi:hypothetical protein